MQGNFFTIVKRRARPLSRVEREGRKRKMRTGERSVCIFKRSQLRFAPRLDNTPLRTSSDEIPCAHPASINMYIPPPGGREKERENGVFTRGKARTTVNDVIFTNNARLSAKIYYGETALKEHGDPFMLHKRCYDRFNAFRCGVR